ncbi:MAG: phosphate acyltransferase PlsX [endosymbiont of Galathealinum brachiosum]|uniref:Phosphate acyltransferase n=1 Tax=endosymbiont of Galathealinum brachiosum TaxID=2200906 RepID=A0A370DFN1_9GAMM|nr:MAG: phosphate acyltransferase PlsX [endosymbiont of Galathealinum brachiosum]
MPESPIIAIDAMGGDIGPEVTVAAAGRILKQRQDVKLILVGLEDKIKAELSRLNLQTSDRLMIHHASELVGMAEAPALALRKKKDSSMRVAINLVNEGKANAAVSAGNTGALMATAKFVYKTLPGIDRPAIMTTLPNTKGHTHMLDLGANVDSSAESLFQFAVMGSVTASAVDNVENPRVGLLNVGAESMKGNAQVKAAEPLLQNSDLNYIGFVEGDDIYNGSVDVVVCDGFVGNVSLKSAEGVAKMIGHFMKQEFKRNLLTKVIGLIAMPVLKSFKQRVDHRRYNGASLLGLKQIIIKSHGGADEYAFGNAINVAILEAEKSVPQCIESHLGDLLQNK